MDGRHGTSHDRGPHRNPDAEDPDETLAGSARDRLRSTGLVPIEPDPRIRELLVDDEHLLAVRRAVALDRRQRCTDPPPGVDGDLFVTTRRLVHVGRRRISFGLDDIREAVAAPDRLLLVLANGQGVAIAVDDPRRLRVEIAAARTALRHASRAKQAPPAQEPPAGAPSSARSQRSRR